MSNEPDYVPQRDPYADDELVPFDVQGYSSNRGMWMLALAIFVLLLLGFFIFRAYSSGFRDREEAPKILAADAPDKVVAEQSDTIEKDLAIYDAMKGESVDENVTITESAEMPIKRPGTVNIEVKDRNSAAESTGSTSAPTPAPAPAPVVKSQPVTSPSVSTGDSRYVVQLASLRSRGAAEDTWSGIKSKHGSLLPQGSYMDIVRAEVPNKGTFYRLRLAGLSDKNMADRVCSQLQARNQTCFTTSK